MKQRYYRRFSRTISIATLLSLPLLMLGARKAYQTNANHVQDWLPKNSTEWKDIEWFGERFGNDEILVASWPGCTLDDNRLVRFAKELAQPEPSSGDVQSDALFSYIFTGKQVVKELSSPPADLSPTKAVERMKGWLIGQDGQSTCAVAIVSKAGSENRDATVETFFSAAEAVGLARDEFWIGGSPADGVALDLATKQRFVLLIVIPAIWGALAAWRALKDCGLVAIVLLVSAWAWAASLSLVYISGANLDAVLMVMPALIYLVCISGAVHLTAYFRAAIHEAGLSGALDLTISRGSLPYILSCAATAAGIGSLAISQFEPVRKFGVFGAAGVLIALAALLVLWPAAMCLWSERRERHAEPPRPTAAQAERDAAWWQPLYQLGVARNTASLLLVLLAIPVLTAGLFQVRTSATLEDMLTPESRLIRDYANLQEQIGPLVPIEIVLRFAARDPADSAALIERLEFVESLRRQINRTRHVGGTIAATTFLPDIPPRGGARQVVARRVAAKKIQTNQQTLIDLGMLYADADRGEELWRISSRVEAFADVDYGSLLAVLSGEVEASLAAEKERSGTEATAVICGGVPIVCMAERQLLSDLIESSLTACLLISVAMMVAARSALCGLLAMVPSVFSVLVVFGGLGLWGISVDLGMMMTASVALGIGAAQTMHFLAWFRQGLEGGMNRSQSARLAYQHAASALLQSTLICGLGLLVFAISPFLPIERLAYSMAVLLLVGFLCNMILLPAILTAWLGKCLEPRPAAEPPFAKL